VQSKPTKSKKKGAVDDERIEALKQEWKKKE
jgi:hypothetical protein